MATIEEQLGAAAAKQIEEMQKESESFSPINEKLKEGQNKLLEGLLGSLNRKDPPAHPVLQSEDFQWITLQLQGNPLVIPYMRRKLEEVLVQLKADIEASLKRSLNGGGGLS